MNRYQVEYVTLSYEAGDDVVCGNIYVNATSREDALYLAVDELADQGLANSGLSLGAVSIESGNGTFYEIQAHAKVDS